MPTYAIGDVQGCFSELRQLLDKISFKSDCDQLWFVGDLVNRGPDSLKVLRFVKSLGDQAITVLGNHDLHLLALAHGIGEPRRLDTISDVLQASDREELLHWLASRPLMHHDTDLGVTMLHAGLPPQWDRDLAQACAREAETVLRSDQVKVFYQHMYGNQPDRWSDQLTGTDRIRFIVNCFTRMRFCDAENRLNMKEKGPLGSTENLIPWFEIAGRKSKEMNIVFGHWSALGYYSSNGVTCLDSGCLWGGSLYTLCLQSPQLQTRVDCPQTLSSF